MTLTIRRPVLYACLSVALSTAAAVLYSLYFASALGQGAARAAGPGDASQGPGCCGGPGADDRLHLLAGSYYSLRDGFASKLLLNNKGPRPLEVRPTLFSTRGERLDLAPLIVDGNSFRLVDMREWVAAPQFEEGSVHLLHHGRDLVLGAQVFINDEARSLAFEEKLVEPATFKSSRLEGLWWLPNPRGEVTLAVSNASDVPVSATVTVAAERPRAEAQAVLELAAHETRLLDVGRDLLGREPGATPRLGGISISHTGERGAVLARALASDEAGYSLAVQFTEPAAAKSAKLHGAGLRVGLAGGDRLTPVFVARNVGPEAATVTGRLPYTAADGSVLRVRLPGLFLAPGEMAVIDASDEVRDAGLSRGAAVGVEFEYTGGAGAVIVTALSYGRGGDLLFRVPLWDVHAQRSSTGGYPWSIDADSATAVYIKNTAAHAQRYFLQLHHAGGVYSVGIKTVEGGQTVAYDLRELRDRQVPGANGEVIPLDAGAGQLHWSKVGAEDGVLIGRAELADVARGVSSHYACVNCCNDNPTDPAVTPSSAQAVAGGATLFRATERLRDCYGGVSGPTEVFAARWSSSDESVATVSAGQATALAPGTVTLTADWHSTSYEYHPDVFEWNGVPGLGGSGSCEAQSTEMRAAATYTVQPSVRVTGASLCDDRIDIRLEPAGATGLLRVFLDGPGGPFELAQRNQQGGDVRGPFPTANLPAREFTSIRATWSVNNLVGTHSLNFRMVVLGDYLQTCYNVPAEHDFSGGTVNAGTATSQCQWSSRSFRSRFLDEVNENGSGIDLAGTALQLESFCGGAPATSPAYAGRRYRRPADIRTSCSTQLGVDRTVARGPGSSLSCGTPVFIAGLGCRVVEDRGGGLANDQLDNYKGVGAAACAGWANPRRKTVRLF